MKRIVLITTGQPSVNPRIVKEADVLAEAGYDVHVLFCFWIGWATLTDRNLLAGVKWSFKLIGGSPLKNKLLYYYTKGRHKFNLFLNRYSGNDFLLPERAQARAFDELLRTAKAIKADWYIGHNLGSLAIVVEAANANGGKSGFDFEDYHRQENSDLSFIEQKRIIYLEEKYCRHLSYVSSSSTEISKMLRRDLCGFKKEIITLFNCFPLSQQPPFQAKLRKDNSLQLFWFSQTIGKNRGLEELIQALRKLNDPLVYLTLAGSLDEDFADYLKQEIGDLQENIKFAGVIEPGDLPAYAASFDIGLAIERSTPYNRDICLTNKIFTYLLAGNAIILSKTKMQQSFNETYKVGESFCISDAYELADKIRLYQDKELLKLQRIYNYKLARNKFNWDIESQKFLEIFA